MMDSLNKDTKVFIRDVTCLVNVTSSHHSFSLWTRCLPIIYKCIFPTKFFITKNPSMITHISCIRCIYSKDLKNLKPCSPNDNLPY
uniref:Uncharacterized protein n=1 Tax=Lepeophtheirus salmonis TaxID=72036 RepID=A0A0K2UGL8_LEPSM